MTTKLTQPSDDKDTPKKVEPIGDVIISNHMIHMLTDLTNTLRNKVGKPFRFFDIKERCCVRGAHDRTAMDQYEKLLSCVVTRLKDLDTLTLPTCDNFPSTEWSGATIETTGWRVISNRPHMHGLVISTKMIIEFASGQIKAIKLTLPVAYQHNKGDAKSFNSYSFGYECLQQWLIKTWNRSFDGGESSSVPITDILFSWIVARLPIILKDLAFDEDMYCNPEELPWVREPM